MRRLAVILCAGWMLAACGKGDEAPPPAVQPRVSVDLARLERGAQLYQRHCLECHGPEAQGHPAWDGSANAEYVAAPPLTGSGPSVRRTKPELLQAIKAGVRRNGRAVMPGWQDRMSEQDMEDILLWVQSLWPIEVYQRWHEANRPGPSS